MELQPVHVSFYFCLDLSSFAKEVLRFVQHFLNFLVVKTDCAPDICRIFAANSCDGKPRNCLVKRGLILHTIYDFSISMSQPLKFPTSMILFRISNTTLSDHFCGYLFSNPCLRFFSNALSSIPMLSHFLQPDRPSLHKHFFCFAKVRSF